MRLFGFAGDWPDSLDRDLLSRYTASETPGAAMPWGGCQAPGLHTEGRLTIAVEGAPVWSSGAPASLPELLGAYRRKGRQFLGEVHGRFALAVIENGGETVLLALDRMGIEKLSYATVGRGIVFSSSVAAVAGFPAIRAPLRMQALFDYLLMHMVPSPDTVYENVRKLRAGTCAVFQHGAVKIERYWLPAFVENGGDSFEDLRRDLQSSLASAVRDCAPDERTGAFLSGGLDSSSVAGTLARNYAGTARSFSIGFGVEGFDELQYARIASSHFGLQPHEYTVTPEDIVHAFPKIAAAYDEPFGNSSAVPTYFCARLAAGHGVNHLLAGDGGDEIFGGNERYSRQRIFEAYGRLPLGLRRRIIEPAVRRIHPEHAFTPLRKLRSYVDQARIAMPERLETWNLMYRTDLATMLEPEFRAAIDPRAPLLRMAEVYQDGPSDSLLHKMLFYDWHYTLADNDLRKVGTMCELAGVKVSYPMLHPKVVDVSIRVPPAVKMQGGRLRTFYKRAMNDFLPHEILHKSKHGFGLPFGLWLKTHKGLGDLIYSQLTDLKSRRIVRASFLDTLIEEHKAGHPGYFGYAMWDLAMLEAWFKARDAGNS